MPPSLPPSIGSSSRTASAGSMPSTLPSDPSEISETAQALLQAHYGRLKQGSSSDSTSSDSQRSLLAKLEQVSANIDRICLQLDNLQVTQQLHAGKDSAQKAARTLQPLGPLAFWPARLVHNDDKVFVRRDPSGLSIRDQLLLEDQVLPTLTQSPKGNEKVNVSVKLPEPNRTIEVTYVKVGHKDAQMQLQAKKAKFVAAANELREKLGTAVPTRTSSQNAPTKTDTMASSADMHLVSEDNKVLNEEGLPFYEPVEKITEEEATRTKKAYMQPFVRSDDQATIDKEKRKQWLDDMLSKLEDEEQNEVSDQDDEEAAATSMAASAAAPKLETQMPAEEETRVVLRTRTPSPPPSPEDSSKAKALPEIVSATRPPPPKSALKASAARPQIVQRPSFGSAGIRHGFLNLNPSSPGAIKSSYSWEDLEKEEKPQQQKSAESERPSRSQTPTPLSRNSSTAGSSLLSRVTDATNSSPLTSGTSTPTKKSVRIKSPERAHPEASAGSGLTPLQRALRSSIRVKENYNEPSSSSSSSVQQSQQSSQSDAMARQLDAGSGTAEKRHKDDVGVEEEAERIVKLLGPDVVEGHPSAPPADVLKKMQEAHEEDKRYSTPEAVAARAKEEEEERERERLQRLQEKPALGHAVMERPRGSASASADKGKGRQLENEVKATQAKFSAFKAGFLNQKPTKFVPNTSMPRKAGASVPAAPTESLGMSALDRASLGDDELSERRKAMGLPAAVPHARPSKAYAEKMKLRQEGRLPDSTASKDTPDGAAEKEVKLARPVADDDVPRPGRVRFGPPASARDDEEAEEQQAMEINPSAGLENHQQEEEEELDEEQEEPRIEGEGADADTDDDEDEDAYFDEYLQKRSKGGRAAAIGESRGGLNEEDADDFDDEDDWDVDEDDEDDFDEDEDDDFDYDPEDLMALAPKLGPGADSFGDNSELLREYEEARAKLAAMGLGLPGSAGQDGGGKEDASRAMFAAARAAAGAGEGEEDEDDYEMDVVPLDAALEDPEYQGNTISSGAGSGSRISRFKASLKQQQQQPPKSAGTNIEDLLASAQNLGQSDSTEESSAAFGMDGMSGSTSNKEGNAPVMIIPQLAPVRFPKNGDLVEGKSSGPVDLNGGDSDEDDEKAEMVMRSRLERLEWKKNHPEEARKLKESKKAKEAVEQGIAPPAIGSRSQEKVPTVAREEEAAEVVEASKPKKVSRFKAARMGQ